jgi:hypothetical protein
MRRTGTSLVARVLLELGYFFENDSKPADEDNPEGYWESKRVQDLNTALLYGLGGTRQLPPKISDGWEKEKRFATRSRAVQEILADYAKHDLWGIKDTRFSLTLPFWKPFLSPDVAYIICIRNPLAVIDSWSVMSREKVNPLTGFRAWHSFVANAIKNTQGGRRFLVFYEDFGVDPRKVTSELCKFLGRDFNPALTSLFTTKLVRHKYTTEQFLRAKEAPSESRLLYLTLLASKSNPAILDDLSEALFDFQGYSPPFGVRTRIRLVELGRELVGRGRRTAMNR